MLRDFYSDLPAMSKSPTPFAKATGSRLPLCEGGSFENNHEEELQ
jgi:hypothetical protein